MSSRSEESPPVSVVVAVQVGDPAGLPDTLQAIERQVYEPVRVVVVGGDRAGRLEAEKHGAAWVASTPRLFAALDPNATHLWFVHAGGVPRPDALQALVRESERADAGVAGSKLLRRTDPERLLAVGIATDVYDTPYLGLEPDEVDQGQFDVVRDVAAVVGASMLIRRDLAVGLGGPDPLMGPEAAAIDLCQRARLRGARVVVVPSSEVLYPEAAYRAEPWKEQAGRIRAMIKVYSPLTLVWALPIGFVIGFIEAVASPFLGRWTLFAWLRAWLWNLVHLPSTIQARHVARQGRVADDAELFRYQVRGSARLKALFGEMGTALRARLPGEDEAIGIAEFGRDLRQPAFVVGAIAVAFVGFATRSIWRGALPAVGYSLPFPASGRDALAAYAGGWNPAGFGSPEPLRPLIGVIGAAQTVLFDRPGLTAAVLVVAAFIAGLWGVTRLLRTWGIEPVAGMVAGVALLAGPAARGLASATDLGTLLALGVLPWALRVPLARFPASWLGRIGRVLAAAWVTGLMAMFSPLLLIVPTGLLLVWALVNLTDRAAWRAVAVAAAGGALAVPLLMPWVNLVPLRTFAYAGDAFWEPGLVLAILAAVAAALTVGAAPTRLALVAGWGGVLAAGGAMAARSGDFGPGVEFEHAALAVVALGTAVIVGAALEAARRFDAVSGWRRMAVFTAAGSAAVVALSAVLILVPGRAGLPADVLDDALGFTRNAEGDAAASRALLVGPAEKLPGDARTIRGAAYRVVSAPTPELWEAWLPGPRAGDDALEDVLESLIDGETFRAGEALAPFGIRWIVVMGESPLERVFDGQLDLIPLGGLERTTFAVEGDPVRAVTSTGVAWSRTGTGYTGPPEQAATVRLAENANGRWGPGEWRQVDWANEVSAAEGEATWRPVGLRRNRATVAAGLFLLYAAGSFVGRRRR